MSFNIDKTTLNNWLKINDQFYLDPDGILGKGCFGEVFRGYWTKQKCLVAIKTMQGEGYERQIETLEALSSLIHPNIMSFYGWTKSQDSVYIFVEFCPNGTLTDLIKKGISEEQTLKLFRQLVEGMCYMNAKSKMHRDLKPDNILIGIDNDIKISDFGLARQTNSIFVTGKMGTPLYAGPEVYLNSHEQNYSQKCDVWGAGMILYEMLTGKILFEGVRTYEQLKSQWMQYQKGQKRVQYQNKVHPNWEYFTNYMLTFDPKKRPSFHQVLQKLKKVYDKMAQQIVNKKVETLNENTKIGRLQIFLNYIQDKYQILLKICQNFTTKDIKIRNEFKSIIIFLCLSHYLCHVKKLIRNLKYKRLKVNQDEDQQLIDDEDHEFDLILDKFRNLFDHKYNFFNDQLRNQIIPKILDYYGSKQQSQTLLKEVSDIIQLVKDVKDGTFDVEQTYNQAFKGLMKNKIEKAHIGIIQSLGVEELRLYNLILIGSLIDEIIPAQNYLKKNFIPDILKDIQKKSREELITAIKLLKSKIK